MREMTRHGSVTPKPFLLQTEMLKRDFASALRQTSGTGKWFDPAKGDVNPSPHILDFVKPLWGIMRVAGVFPVSRCQGKFSFRVLSPAFAYSFGVYVVLGCYAVYVTGERVALINETRQSFSTLVFSCLYILYNLPQHVLPVTHWLEARSVVDFLDSWTDVQRLVELATGSPFVCASNRRKVLLHSLFVLGMCFTLVITEYQLLDAYFLYEVPLYFYTITLVNLHAALWHFLCQALAETSDYLIGALEMEFRRPGPHLPPVVIKYMRAWCRLSRLASDTGHVMVYTLAFILVLWSAVLLLSLYGSLPGGANRDYPFTREVGLAGGALLAFGVVFVVCNAAHQAADTVGRAFHERLGVLKINAQCAHFELDQFMKAVTAKIPVINLGGYVDVNRSLLTSLFSSLATYLIVLVQFKMSDSPSSVMNPPK